MWLKIRYTLTTPSLLISPAAVPFGDFNGPSEVLVLFQCLIFFSVNNFLDRKNAYLLSMLLYDLTIFSEVVAQSKTLQRRRPIHCWFSQLLFNSHYTYILSTVVLNVSCHLLFVLMFKKSFYEHAAFKNNHAVI